MTASPQAVTILAILTGGQRMVRKTERWASGLTRPAGLWSAQPSCDQLAWSLSQAEHAGR